MMDSVLADDGTEDPKTRKGQTDAAKKLRASKLEKDVSHLKVVSKFGGWLAMSRKRKQKTRQEQPKKKKKPQKTKNSKKTKKTNQKKGKKRRNARGKNRKQTGKQQKETNKQ